MGRIEIRLTTDTVEPEETKGKTCVVIDVLRASTTIVAALARGCASVIPVETPEEAREIARKQGCLLGGERNGLPIAGFDFGNSPLEYLPSKIKGRSIAFTTTNGTRAMRRCAFAEKLVVASFLNGAAAVRLLRQQRNDILIVCAGTEGWPSLEDTVCGGMLIERLDTIDISGEAREAVSQWKASRRDLAAMMTHDSEHGLGLVALGFEKDIEFAAQLDAYDIVPIREGNSLIRGT
jgi:2-phosphosulfolactate phosphatase